MRNLPDNLSAGEFPRSQLDRLGIGAKLQSIPWGSKRGSHGLSSWLVCYSCCPPIGGCVWDW